MHKVAEVGRKPGGDVVHARVLAVHGSEGVVHVGAVFTGQGHQLVSEGAALGVVLAGFAGIEPDVLEDKDLAVPQGRCCLPGGAADGVGGEGDLEAGQFSQAAYCGPKGVFLLWSALGASEVGCYQHAGTGVREL